MLDDVDAFVKSFRDEVRGSDWDPSNNNTIMLWLEEFEKLLSVRQRGPRRQEKTSFGRVTTESEWDGELVSPCDAVSKSAVEELPVVVGRWRWRRNECGHVIRERTEDELRELSGEGLVDRLDSEIITKRAERATLSGPLGAVACSHGDASVGVVEDVGNESGNPVERGKDRVYFGTSSVNLVKNLLSLEFAKGINDVLHSDGSSRFIVTSCDENSLLRAIRGEPELVWGSVLVCADGGGRRGDMSEGSFGNVGSACDGTSGGV